MVSSPDSATSSSKRSKRSSVFDFAHTVYSSLVRPSEEWGISDVPLLSPRTIPPRRVPSSAKKPRGASDGKKRASTSAPKRSQKRVSFAPEPIRQLSISSVSTFAADVPDQLSTTDDTNEGTGKIDVDVTDTEPNDEPLWNYQDDEIEVMEEQYRYPLPKAPAYIQDDEIEVIKEQNRYPVFDGPAYIQDDEIEVIKEQHIYPMFETPAYFQEDEIKVMKEQHRCPVFEAPAYVQRNPNIHMNPSTRINPLFMHPPSPPTSPVQPKPFKQESINKPKTVRALRITRTEDDPVFEASLGCSAAWLRRLPVLKPDIHAYDIGAANIDIDILLTVDDMAVEHDKPGQVDEKQVSDTSDDDKTPSAPASPTIFHDGYLPRDAGYVAALRLWFEERDREAMGERAQEERRKLEKARRRG